MGLEQTQDQIPVLRRPHKLFEPFPSVFSGCNSNRHLVGVVKIREGNASSDWNPVDAWCMRANSLCCVPWAKVRPVVQARVRQEVQESECVPVASCLQCLPSGLCFPGDLFKTPSASLCPPQRSRT